MATTEGNHREESLRHRSRCHASQQQHEAGSGVMTHSAVQTATSLAQRYKVDMGIMILKRQSPIRESSSGAGYEFTPLKSGTPSEVDTSNENRSLECNTKE